MNMISGSWLDNHFDVSLVRYRFTKDKLICQYAGYFDANIDLQISKYLINNYKTPVKSLIVALLLQNIIPNYKCTPYELLAIELDKDHVHLLITFKPFLSISQVVRRLKQLTTKYIWDQNENFLRKFYYKNKILWTHGYFCSTIGEVSETTIKKVY